MKNFMGPWEPICNSFKMHYPDLYNEMASWYPCGEQMITVRLKNGKIVLYEFIGGLITTLRPAIGEPDESRDEKKWRMIFAQNLKNKMRAKGISHNRLAALCDISQVSVSKYINGMTTPSAYTLERMAQALDCSIYELTGEERKD